MKQITALNVAEKPSVANALANIIGDGRASKRIGCAKFNPIFETSCTIKENQVNMIITSVLGHLMEIEFEEPYGRNWSVCKPIDLFHIPIVKRVSEKNKDLQFQLQTEVRKCQWLILWLDCDSEGENIAFEVLEVCQKVNKSLRILRAHFSALIPREILYALENLTEPNRAMSESVEARQEEDLRLGAVFTRFQTQRFQDKFEGLEKCLISYGPCQFPTLGFVVERFQQIQKFHAEKFWGIEVECIKKLPQKEADSHEASEVRAVFSWDRGCIFDKAIVSSLAELCIEKDFAVITAVTRKPQTRFKPLPLNTVDLQRRAARYMHVSSERTMKAAESLYQKGYISYPRTETNIFSKETDIRSYVNEFKSSSTWGDTTDDLLEKGKFEWPRNGASNDNAHPPIYPTKSIETNTLEGDERKIYELVVKHFLACCSKDSKGELTSVHMHMGEDFTVKGLFVTEKNWLEIYSPWEKWSDKLIPFFEVGEKFVPSFFTITNGETKPPTLLSESDLIKLMDQNGIGTDATIAEHIKKIQVLIETIFGTITDRIPMRTEINGDRDYVRRDNNGHFTPTNLGIALVNGYNSIGIDLAKPFHRQAQEHDCKLVSRNELQRHVAIFRCLEKMKEAFQLCVQNANILDREIGAFFAPAGCNLDIADASFSICGKCNSVAALKFKQDGRERAANRPLIYCSVCRISLFLPAKGVLVPKQPSFFCPLCNFQVIEVQRGNMYEGGGYNLCPWCYNNPPTDVEEAAVQKFPCFVCPGNCSLAKKQGQNVSVMPCIMGCGGSMHISNSGSGIVRLCCASYPAKCSGIVWLPRIVRSVMIDEDDNSCCTTCELGVRYVNVSLNGGYPAWIPSPELKKICIFCSDEIRELNGGVRLSAAKVAKNQGHWKGKRLSETSNQFNRRKDPTFQRVVCNCSKPVAKFIAKHGKNKGRAFAKCAEQKCNFWEWLDTAGSK